MKNVIFLINFTKIVAKDLFGYDIAQTLALLSVVLTELTFTYNCKELKDFSFKKGIFGNKFLNISTLIIFLVQILVFFTPVGTIFGLTSISVLQFLAVLGITIVGFFIIEVIKPLISRFYKDKF